MSVREDLLSVKPQVPAEVQVSGYGTFYFKSLSVDELAKVANLVQVADGEAMPSGESIARVLVLMIANPDGSAAFTDADVPALMRQDGKKLVSIYKAALPTLRMNELVEEEEKKS